MKLNCNVQLQVPWLQNQMDNSEDEFKSYRDVFSKKLCNYRKIFDPRRNQGKSQSRDEKLLAAVQILTE